MARSRNARPRFGGKTPIYTAAHEERRQNLGAQERRLSEKIDTAAGLAKEIALKELQRLQQEQEALQELKDAAAGYQPTAAEIAKAEAQVVRTNDWSDSEEDTDNQSVISPSSRPVPCHLANYVFRSLSSTPPLSPGKQDQAVEIERAKTISQVVPTNDWSEDEGNTDTDNESSTHKGQMEIDRASTTTEGQMDIDWASTSSESSGREFNWVPCDRSRESLLECLFPSRSPSPLLSGNMEYQLLETEVAKDETNAFFTDNWEDGEDKIDINCACDVLCRLEHSPAPQDPRHEGTSTNSRPESLQPGSPAMDQATDHQLAADIDVVEPQVGFTNSWEADEDLDVKEADVDEDIDMEITPVTPSAIDLHVASYEPACKSGLAAPTFFWDFHSQLPTSIAESRMIEPPRMPVISYPLDRQNIATPPWTPECSILEPEVVEYDCVGDDMEMEGASDTPCAIKIDVATQEPARKSGLAAPRQYWGCGLVPIWCPESMVLGNAVAEDTSAGGDTSTQGASNTPSAIEPNAVVYELARKTELALPTFLCGRDSRFHAWTAEAKMMENADVQEAGVEVDNGTENVTDTQDAIGLDFVIYDPARKPGLAYPWRILTNLIPPQTSANLSLDIDLIPLTEWYIKAHRPSTGYQAMDGNSRATWVGELQKFAKDMRLAVRFGPSPSWGIF